jgi:hypothetical protein
MKGTSKLILVIATVSLLTLTLYYGFVAQSDPEFGTVQGFEDHQRRILQRAESSSTYRVLDVIDEGRVIRVNVLVLDADADDFAVKAEVTNVLLDLQTAVGIYTSLSAWAYREGQATQENLLGMAFYHAMTEQTIFKSPEELK